MVFSPLQGETLNIHPNTLALRSCKIYRIAEATCLSRPTIVFDLHRALKGIIIIMIIITGYLTSYPFLGPILDQPSMPLQDADEQVIITADCSADHNLHKDIFYIPDPTSAFIGVTHSASTFSLYDFPAQVLACSLAGSGSPQRQPWKWSRSDAEAGFCLEHF
jgi:hypothetical protein